jgi:pimeloyl-ACP methyl ester carboxylesterase
LSIVPPGPAAAPPETGFRDGYITAQDGLRLYYRDYGPHAARRATALCLPGLARNSRDFHDVAVRLSASRRVLSLDYRGRGRSDYDPDWRHYEPRTYVDDARHLLAATNTHGVVAIGVSLGGLVAMGLAVVMPSAVRAIVLDDVGPEIEAGGMGRIFDILRAMRPQPDWEHAVREMRRTFPKLSIQTDAGWLKFTRATYKEGGDGLLHADWDPNIVKPLEKPAGIPADLWALYRGVAKIPVLAVRGGESDVLGEATFRRMKAEKPDLVQVTLPGVGHAPTLTEPVVTAALDAFLANL